MVDSNGKRAVNNLYPKIDHDPNFRDYVLFYEYFDGDNGRGVGASHQTGWTGVIAKIIQDTGSDCRLPGTTIQPGEAVAQAPDDKKLRHHRRLSTSRILVVRGF
jgi:hypothetical protein